jgi:hypothetical protein
MANSVAAARATAAPGATTPGTPSSGATSNGSTLSERMLLRLNPVLSDPTAIETSAGLVATTLAHDQPVLTPDLFMQRVLGQLGPASGQTATGPFTAGPDTTALAQYMVLHQLVRPITDAASTPILQGALGSSVSALSTLLGAELPPVGPAAAPAATAAGPAATGEDVTSLRAELVKLQQSIAAQAKQIKALQGKSTK